jgi:hypothetical protein
LPWLAAQPMIAIKTTSANSGLLTSGRFAQVWDQAKDASAIADQLAYACEITWCLTTDLMHR